MRKVEHQGSAIAVTFQDTGNKKKILQTLSDENRKHWETECQMTFQQQHVNLKNNGTMVSNPEGKHIMVWNFMGVSQSWRVREERLPIYPYTLTSKLHFLGIWEFFSHKFSLCIYIFHEATGRHDLPEQMNTWKEKTKDAGNRRADAKEGP